MVPVNEGSQWNREQVLAGGCSDGTTLKGFADGTTLKGWSKGAKLLLYQLVGLMSMPGKILEQIVFGDSQSSSLPFLTA